MLQKDIYKILYKTFCVYENFTMNKQAPCSGNCRALIYPYSEKYDLNTYIIPFGVAFVERQVLFLYPFFIYF